jgi:hypothetical protein
MAQPLHGLLGYPNSQVCCTFYHIVLQMDSSLKMLDIHFCKKTLPNASSLPIFMVYPSHTSLAYLILPDLTSLFVHLILGDMLC